MNEYEYSGMSDDELIRRAVTARNAGDHDEVRRILAVLAYRRYGNVVRRVAVSVPRDDVEDVAMEALASAIKAAFEGTSVGEFVNFLNTIVSRRIADFTRSRPPRAAALPDEHEGEDDYWGRVLGGGDPADSLLEHIDAAQAVRQALDELGDPHRGVVTLFVFEGYRADESADQVNTTHRNELETPMSEANVHQIASRFRRRVRRLLEEAEDSG